MRLTTMVVALKTVQAEANATLSDTLDDGIEDCFRGLLAFPSRSHPIGDLRDVGL
jgi:hypothetical protein